MECGLNCGESRSHEKTGVGMASARRGLYGVTRGIACHLMLKLIQKKKFINILQPKAGSVQ